MNVANLQLQGLYLAIAAVNAALVRKGVLTHDEIDFALRSAEQVALGDDRMTEDMTPASRDAVAFAARFLTVANQGAAESEVLGFSEIAKRVGQTKGHYGDQT